MKFISNPILLAILSIFLKKNSANLRWPEANRHLNLFVGFCFVDNLVLPFGRSICIILFSLLIRPYGELNCGGLHILITFIYSSLLHCLHPHINPCWPGSSSSSCGVCAASGLCSIPAFNTLSAKDGDLRLSASNACLPKTEISVFVTECVIFTSSCYKLHMFTLHDVLYS